MYHYIVVVHTVDMLVIILAAITSHLRVAQVRKCSNLFI